MISIRHASPDDWPRMREVFISAGQAAWPHILPLPVLNGLNPPDRWREAISDPSQVVLVGFRDLVDGFAVLRASGDSGALALTGELDSFYVHPSAWGQGVGRALLAAALDRLIEMGFSDVTLWTAELNHRPRRIYETAGFELDGARRERALGGQRFVELRYRLSLRPA